MTITKRISCDRCTDTIPSDQEYAHVSAVAYLDIHCANRDLLHIDLCMYCLGELEARFLSPSVGS